MSEKAKLLCISHAIQIAFVLLAIVSLAFAQAIGASLSLMTVLSVLGACFAIELIVTVAIWCYLHFSKGTLDDVSDGVRHAGHEMFKRAKGISDAVAGNGDDEKPTEEREEGDEAGASSGEDPKHEQP